MSLRDLKIILVLALLFLSIFSGSGQAHGWKMVHGNVVQVFPEQHKILLESNGLKHIYVLDTGCQILRLGVPTSLESLVPISPGAWQDALCWIDSQGFLAYILVNYSVQEEDGMLVAYDIFGNLK